MSRDPDPAEGGPPQLHIWDVGVRELPIGRVELDGERWSLHLIVERTAPDLFAGRLCFRRGERRLETAAVIVEESEEEVARRATALPAGMLRQFLASVRD